MPLTSARNMFVFVFLSFPAPWQISLVDALYRKSLRVSSATKGDMGVGKIVNLQSNDAGGRAGGWAGAATACALAGAARRTGVRGSGGSC